MDAVLPAGSSREQVVCSSRPGLGSQKVKPTKDCWFAEGWAWKETMVVRFQGRESTGPEQRLEGAVVVVGKARERGVRVRRRVGREGIFGSLGGRLVVLVLLRW